MTGTCPIGGSFTFSKESLKQNSQSSPCNCRFREARNGGLGEIAKILFLRSRTSGMNSSTRRVTGGTTRVPPRVERRATEPSRAERGEGNADGIEQTERSVSAVHALLMQNSCSIDRPTSLAAFGRDTDEPRTEKRGRLPGPSLRPCFRRVFIQRVPPIEQEITKKRVKEESVRGVVARLATAGYLFTQKTRIPRLIIVVESKGGNGEDTIFTSLPPEYRRTSASV